MYSNPQKDRKVGTLEILGKYHPYHAGNTVLSSLGLLYTWMIYIYMYIWAYVLLCCIESMEPALKKKVVYRHVSIPSTAPWVLPEIEVALHFHVSSQQVWVVISHIISNTFPKLELFRSSLEIIWERCWIFYHNSRYGHYALHIIPHYLLENIISNDFPIV